MESATLITVAVICKNEVSNMARCLESILASTSHLEVEVLVVDSYSTDGTVELAQKYPVTIIQLGYDWPHSPAAGRYTAVLHAKGRYLLLIDGDMELIPGFIEKALAQMEVNPEVVAVRGRLHNFHKINGDTIHVNSKFAKTTSAKERCQEDTPELITCASGSALFRLIAIREAGNFQPFLKAEEEYEIAQRLRTRGGKLLYIPVDAVNHYGYLPDPLREVGRRLRRGLVGGVGQMIRLSFQEGYGWENFHRFRLQLVLGCFSLLFIPAVLFAWVWPPVPLIWLSLSLIFLITYWVKKRDLRSAFAACLLNVLIGIDIIRGALISVPPREAYPTTVTMINGTFVNQEGVN
ncbi:MAG: hypothetical protein C0618_08980 [Desulfuromonas sp.]|nr:MAG: hypothetical protein C0618_08980 [Desulfuromonas sp.]